jgi:hypothetical protein
VGTALEANEDRGARVRDLTFECGGLYRLSIISNKIANKDRRTMVVCSLVTRG